MPFDPSDDDDAWWSNLGPLRLTIHPAALPNPPSNPPSNAALVPGGNYNDWARRNGPAGGADLPNDWFVPQPSAPSASSGDSLPDDWLVPQPSVPPSPTQSPSGPQSSALNPVAPNPPATPRDLLEAYWSLVPASRVGAFAWHPPIFLNSDGQFLRPAPTYDPPVLPAYRLFGGMTKMPSVFAAANARPIGGGGGLFDSLAGQSAANTDAPPPIFGATAPPPNAAPMPGGNPSPSPSYPPYLGGSALRSYLADPPPPPDPTLFAWLPQLPGPTAAGDSPLGPWNGVPAASSQGPAAAAPPTRSVLFNHAPAAWDPGAPDRSAANLDQTARTLGLSDLPISKSGTPFISPPPQLSIAPQQGLDVAHLVSPNLVDYFTKTPPPAPPLPATPGKIPSSDNPYALGAASEAAAWLLTLLSAGAAAPLGIAPVSEEVALQGTTTALGAPALVGGNLSREASGRIVAALQAAVNAGSLTREQAAVLLQRANGVGEAAGAKLEAPLSRWLPKYDGTTYGLLITNEGRVVPLQSGPPRGFPRYPPSKHAEGKGAIWIRENGSSGGVLYHNNTEGTCGFCDRQLERLLPSKAVLDVVPPPDAVPKNAMAVAKPSPYVGDDTVPNPLPHIQQPDFFGNQP